MEKQKPKSLGHLLLGGMLLFLGLGYLSDYLRQDYFLWGRWGSGISTVRMEGSPALLIALAIMIFGIGLMAYGSWLKTQTKR